MVPKIEQRTYWDGRTYAEVIRDGKIVNFPLDVISEILSRLPIVVIIRCKCVCKSWYKLTTEPYFIELHKNRAFCQPRHIILATRGRCKSPPNTFFYIDKGEGNWKCRTIPVAKNIELWSDFIVGSCNGLLLLASRYMQNAIFVYNPITRECIELPELDPDGFDFKNRFCYGFGFDPINKKYKVACVYCRYYSGSDYFDDDDDDDVIIEDTDTRCHMLTVGESSWRSIEVPYQVLIERGLETVLLNGAFHWIIDRRHVRSSGSEVILALDISNEKFHTINFPPTIKLPDSLYLINLAQSLALVESVIDEGLFRIWHIVSSKTDGRSVYQYACPHLSEIDGSKYFCRILGMLSNGSFLYQASKQVYPFCSHSDDISMDQLAVYIPQKKECFILEISGTPNNFYTEFFVPTLVSPSAICRR